VESSSSSCCAPRRKIDWLLWISMLLVIAGLTGHLLGLTGPAWWQTFSHATAEFMAKSWWGILAGILAVGIIGRLPQTLVSGLLGKGGTFGGILRATFAGVLLDLCNHGILMIGSQLYRRGASLGQTLAFLVASPWNSFSLTLMLAALIGWKWMLTFTAVSMVIGIITGWIADLLVNRGKLPENPNTRDLPDDFRFGPAFKEALVSLKPNAANVTGVVKAGLADSRMILRWIFFGVVMAAAIRAFVPDSYFAGFFGPTIVGLLLTLLATTLIEVCTEGSSPIAADLLTRAAAPGNAFVFLMAGASTDYTEMLVLRETTGSWKAALAVPLITIPQVLLIGWLMNHYSMT
jgi:uncharacterized membrane protein YraQ (UPF0718 family)